MARFCDGCGKQLEDGKPYCDKCGRKAPVYPAAPAPQPQKARSGLFLGFGLGAVIMFLVLVVVVGGGALAYFVFNSNQTPAPTATPAATQDASLSSTSLDPFPDDMKVGSGPAKVSCTVKSPDFIIPANYSSLDYIAYLQCSTQRGSAKLSVSVEIPEFTQKFETVVDVSRADTVLSIHPPLLKGAAQSLTKARDAQVVVMVKDVGSGEAVFQESRPVKLFAYNDMMWEDESGTLYYENILAWVTPDAPEIVTMLRDSSDSLNELTGGKLDALIGYQPVGDWSADQITKVQIEAMMYTLAKKYNVQYTNAASSSTREDLQSIATPSQVIKNSAGLCIETTVTLASALQRSTMHAFIILLPGHSQVAVETWEGSGEYFLVETTALDAAREKKFDEYVLGKLSQEQWKEYLSREGYVAIDCRLAQQLNISPLG